MNLFLCWLQMHQIVSDIPNSQTALEFGLIMDKYRLHSHLHYLWQSHSIFAKGSRSWMDQQQVNLFHSTWRQILVLENRLSQDFIKPKLLVSVYNVVGTNICLYLKAFRWKVYVIPMLIENGKAGNIWPASYLHNAMQICQCHILIHTLFIWNNISVSQCGITIPGRHC